MREILFKAKRVDNGEWVEGCLAKGLWVENDEPMTIIIPVNVSIYYGCELAQFYIVDPDTICQYTGMTDKNGEKIWENDICHHHGMHDDICVIRYGEYDDNCSNKKHVGFYPEWRDFRHLYRKDLGFWVSEREIEVIGNAIDNADF